MSKHKHLDIVGDMIYCASSVYDQYVSKNLEGDAWLAGEAKLRAHLEAELQVEMPKRWQRMYDSMIALGNHDWADAVKRKMNSNWKARAPRIIVRIKEEG